MPTTVNFARAWPVFAAMAGLFVGGCEPDHPAAGGPVERPAIYSIDRAAGDDRLAVYHIKDNLTGKVTVMAWSHLNSGGMWVKIDEFHTKAESKR